MKVLFLRIQDLQKSWNKGFSNWNKIQNELSLIFEDRFLRYFDIYN